ncbi:MAG: hypothetical protein MET45_07140 [Nostoc sp. LLA-1]|nr:hypothetical protein [Cyanocohniella sp. LLY]
MKILTVAFISSSFSEVNQEGQVACGDVEFALHNPVSTRQSTPTFQVLFGVNGGTDYKTSQPNHCAPRGGGFVNAAKC